MKLLPYCYGRVSLKEQVDFLDEREGIPQWKSGILRFISVNYVYLRIIFLNITIKNVKKPRFHKNYYLVNFCARHRNAPSALNAGRGHLMTQYRVDLARLSGLAETARLA